MDFDLQRSADQFTFGDLYEVVAVLGAGAYGKVLHCRSRASGQDCAVKQVSKASAINLAAVASEVQILASLSHPHVVAFRGVHHDPCYIYIEMELLSGGSLSTLLAKKRLSEEEAATIMRGVLAAVSYLHKRAVLHRDLKPDNILFADESLASVKVTDFGLSAKFGQRVYDTFDDTCGTVAFMAPEQVNRTWYSKPVDIWSCGIILYMVVIGQHPMLQPEDSVESYIAKLRNPVWSFPQEVNPQVRQLFLHMTNKEPIDRYTADQALKHPWVSRTQSEIPKTFFEKVTEYNETSRLKALVGALVGIGAVRYRAQGKVEALEVCILVEERKESPAPSPAVRSRRLSAGVYSFPAKAKFASNSKSPSRVALKPALFPAPRKTTPAFTLGLRKGY